ncbi:MAG: tRNA (N(6)-L-threonylcarbamoyladenosine(37)-C(2))-methylthiotransferase MtaB [Gammaproteobacteria bacterium]
MQAVTDREDRAAIVTLGCKVNTFESAAMAQALGRDQWRLVDPSEPAALYIVNSCTVTAEADRQTRQVVRRLLRQSPGAKVVLTGCYAQNEAEACAEIPGVTLILGNDHKADIVRHVRDLRESDSEKSVIRVDRMTGLPPALLKGFEGQTRAFLQVQQGCDQSCTFCVIHRARGASYSFNTNDILRQAETFLDNGYQELVICGVDLGSFSEQDAESENGGLPLVRLLEKMSALPGNFLIRLSSIDPVHLSNELLQLMGLSDRFCPYLHVSMQSGSTLILKRMKRRYDREFLLDRLREARETVPDLVVGGDIMVGFPTETEADFEASKTLIEEANVIYPHIFPFSPRPGTPAAKIPRQIPKAERKRRAADLRSLGKVLRARALGDQIGSTHKVLIERGHASMKGGGYNGRLPNYMPVRFSEASPRLGERARSRIIGVDDEVLIADAIADA